MVFHVSGCLGSTRLKSRTMLAAASTAIEARCCFDCIRSATFLPAAASSWSDTASHRSKAAAQGWDCPRIASLVCGELSCTVCGIVCRSHASRSPVWLLEAATQGIKLIGQADWPSWLAKLVGQACWPSWLAKLPLPQQPCRSLAAVWQMCEVLQPATMLWLWTCPEPALGEFSLASKPSGSVSKGAGWRGDR